jgi:hypothetical protein
MLLALHSRPKIQAVGTNAPISVYPYNVASPGFGGLHPPYVSQTHLDEAEPAGTEPNQQTKIVAENMSWFDQCGTGHPTRDRSFSALFGNRVACLGYTTVYRFLYIAAKAYTCRLALCNRLDRT